MTWQELVQRHSIIQQNKQVDTTLNVKKSLRLCPKSVALISFEGELFSCWLLSTPKTSATQVVVNQLLKMKRKKLRPMLRERKIDLGQNLKSV